MSALVSLYHFVQTSKIDSGPTMFTSPIQLGSEKRIWRENWGGGSHCHQSCDTRCAGTEIITCKKKKKKRGRYVDSNVYRSNLQFITQVITFWGWRLNNAESFYFLFNDALLYKKDVRVHSIKFQAPSFFPSLHVRWFSVLRCTERPQPR